MDITPGFFQLMDNVIWEDEYDTFDMDIELITNHGLKTTSPLIDHFISDDSFEGNGFIEDEDMRKIANLVYRKYRTQWEKKYQVLKAEYDLFDTFNVEDNTTTVKTKTGYEQGNDDRTGQTDKSTNTTGTRQLDRDNEEVRVKEGIRDNNVMSSNVRSNTDVNDRDESVNTNDDSELEYINRKDREVRDLSTGSLKDSKTTDTTFDELSYNNRKDQNDRSDVETNSGHTKDTETGTTITDDTGRETETTYGFDSGLNPGDGGSGGSLTGADGVPKGRNIKDLNTTETNTNENRHDIDTTNSSEISETSTKTGSERNQRGGDVKIDDIMVGIDEGTIDNSKEGKEKTTNVKDLDGNESAINSQSGIESDTLFDSSSYEDEDVYTQIGTESSVDSGEKDEIGSEDVKTDSINITHDSDFEDVENVVKGNTSNRTAVDIMQEHVDFWQWNFIDDVIEDVIDMITLDVYEY